MKVQTNKAVEKFEPIDITITVESLREMEILYRIFNSSSSDLESVINNCSATKLISAAHKHEIETLKSPIWKIIRPSVKPY